MPNVRTAFFLFLILALAAVVRFCWIGHYCSFFDEAWNDELSVGRGSVHIQLSNDTIYASIGRPTSLNAAPSWWSIWTHTDHVTHPPLYLIVLRWWRGLFGESLFVSRSCSAVLSSLALLWLFDVARLLHGPTAALWGCAIMSMAGAQVLLAQEVRPYALLLLLSMGALSAVVKLEKLGPTTSRFIALGCCILGMLLTHYFAAPAMASIALYALLRLHGRSRRGALAAIIGAGVIFAITWGPWFLSQRGDFSSAAETWLGEASAGHVRRTVVRLAQIPLRLMMSPPHGAFPLGYLSAALLALPFIMLKRRPEMLLWCLWLCGTVFFVAAMDLARSTQHLSYIRYSVIGGPAIYMTLAVLLPRRGLAGHLVPACVVLACAFALPETYAEFTPDFRPLARHIQASVQPDDCVVFYSGGREGWFSNAMYLNVTYNQSASPWRFILMTHPPDAALAERLSRFRSIWFVNHSREMTAAKLLPGAQVDGFQFFPFIGTCERIDPGSHLKY